MASLREFEPMVARRTRQLVELLSSKKGEVNIAKWFSWFTYVLCVCAIQCRRCNVLTLNRYDLMSDMA